MSEEWNPIGLTIVAAYPVPYPVHPWEGAVPPIGFELSDGSVLYASRDEEGNGPGIFFVFTPGDEDPLVLSAR